MRTLDVSTAGAADGAEALRQGRGAGYATAWQTCVEPYRGNGKSTVDSSLLLCSGIEKTSLAASMLRTSSGMKSRLVFELTAEKLNMTTMLVV